MIGEHRILDSWKEISDYLKRDIRTCRRYERDLGLPVRRLDGTSQARVFAYQDEIDVWLAKKLGGRPSLIPRLLYFISSKPLAALFLSVFIFGLGVTLDHCLSGRREAAAGRSDLKIAVLPFQNTSARADLDKWMHGIPQLLMPSLSGSKYFSVIGYDRTLDTLRELGIDPAKPYAADDLVRIKRRSGATHAVTGILIGAGDGLCIALATKKIGADEAFSSRFDCADGAAIIEAAGRIADQVKRDLGLTRTTQSDDFDAIGVPVTAASLEAFRLYNEGRRLHVAGDYEKSARIMRRALDLDPQFALAWRSLAASLASQGEEPAATLALPRRPLLFGRPPQAISAAPNVPPSWPLERTTGSRGARLKERSSAIGGLFIDFLDVQIFQPCSTDPLSPDSSGRRCRDGERQDGIFRDMFGDQRP